MSYTPFIVLTAPRSGSSMLIQALRAHPRIVSFGELFNRGHIGFNTPGFENRNRMLQSWRDRHPAEFMQRMVYRGYDESVQAVGFKVFYEHVDRPQLRPLKSYLAQKPELRVIHLRRRNLLRAFLSRTIALRTGVWGAKSPRQRRHYRVRLKPADCHGYFEMQSRQWAEYDKVFAFNALLRVTFETLVAEFEPEMERVLDFLGADKTCLPRLTVKQEVRPLAEAIIGYAELKSEFAGTRWAEMFDE
ncbi:MAG: sulfotransferase [Gemmatimonadota bacterium]